LDGEYEKESCGLSVEIAGFSLLETIHPNELKTDLPGLRNGYWKDRRSKFLVVIVAFRLTPFNDYFILT
jgi:hypothetical protein